MGKKKAQLFGDNDDDCDDISVNEEFARRYEHNKKREALQRYEELKKKGQIESDSQSESESESESEWSDSDLMNPSKKKDIKFFENLLKIRNRDPSLYRKDVNLFNSDASEEEEEEEEEEESDGNDKPKKKKKKETMYLKDVIGKQLMETGPDFDEEDEEEEEEEDAKKKRRRGKSYNEEQEELKKAILDAVKDAEKGDDDEGGELFKVKEKSNEVEKEEAEDGGEDFRKKVLEFFGKEEDLDENAKFLKSFFEEKMWVDKSKKGKKGAIDHDLNELERDEEDIERQDQYELDYNFRHEENAGDRVLGHSRIVEDSVRKKDNARKVQRQNKMERMKLEEMQRKEELKHLKNLKKEEIKEKMKRVVKIAGIKEDDHLQLDLDDLEDDFDPEEYDKMMKKVFDEKYYGAKDLDPAFDTDNDEDGDGDDMEKPDFDREDELLGLPKGWDVTESSNAFLAVRERSLKRKAENGIEENDYEEHEEEGSDKGRNEEDDGGREEDRATGEDGSDESKRKRKRKMSLVKRAREAMMEEYYKLDYEDTIGDLKTRFKYAKVDPERYGLHTEDILVLDDKDLNQYVSSKKLAPYRDGKWKVPKSKKREYKTKLIELYNGKYAEKQNNRKRRSKDKNDKSIGSSHGGKTEEKKYKGDTSNMSRKARRKSKFKISVDRQKAYGK